MATGHTVTANQRGCCYRKQMENGENKISLVHQYRLPVETKLKINLPGRWWTRAADAQRQIHMQRIREIRITFERPIFGVQC